MRRIALVLVIVALAGCGGDEITVTTEPGGTPVGFERVAATATMADGTVCELCLWLADRPETRRRGLMGVTDMGAADGMVFQYDDPTSGTFWMKDTLLPLSIAFYDADGNFQDSFDMVPCEADPCLHYPTPDNFSYAIEVTEGKLESSGLVPGSVLLVSDTACGV